MKKIIRNIKINYRLIGNYYKSATPASKEVIFYNWGIPPMKQDYWLAEFIHAKKILPKEFDKKIALFTVWGRREMMKWNHSDYKIFLARENVHRENWVAYSDLCLEKKWLDLSIGFDYLKHEKYLRFPLWLMWVFRPNDTYEDIVDTCKKINDISNFSYDDRKFCSFLCSHDDKGRLEIYNELTDIGSVDCDGRLFHNNDDLKEKFKDDKLAYLRQYRFNLCPENSNYEGYCTEKLFEAIYSGCIPIYWGTNQQPEPDVINQNAILFIELGKSNQEAIQKVKLLNGNKELYMEFASQPRLTKNAPEIIWNYYIELEKKLKEILK